jgi:hypothetical protein
MNSFYESLQMKKIFSLALFCLFVCQLSGQANPDTINRVDKGKKYGWQLEYLDTTFQTVKKEDSYYSRYTWFSNDNSYDPVDIGKGSRIVFSEPVTPAKGQPMMLTGGFVVFEKNGKWIDSIEYKDGYRSGIHKCYKNGILAITIAFDKKFQQDTYYSFFYTEWNKDGTVNWQGYYMHTNIFGKEGEYVVPNE